MGQYKVPQNVEAEDKIIGPLTMKQFIYAMIGVMWFGLCFVIFSKIPVIMLVIGLPPALFFLFLAAPRGQDQTFEALFLALLNFYASPRKRVWHKDDIAEAFKIEMPVAVAQAVRRDPSDVRGQLERLSQIVDTRGWAAKQPEIQDPDQAIVIDMQERIATDANAQPAAHHEEVDVALGDDIFDFSNNPNAQNLNTLIEDSVKDIRQEALDKMRSHTKSPFKDPMPATTSGMTTNPLRDMLKVAMENDDLTVSQIAAQASRRLAEGQVVNVRDGASSNPS